EVFWHGWPERVGGVSEGTKSSLNLGTKWGDDPERVAENRRRVAAEAGFDPERLIATKHVHGTRVWRVGEPLPEPAECDGLVTNEPGTVLGAFAADCVPLVFAAPAQKVCGAAHAGWRGTVGRIAANVVARMGELGAPAKDVRV